MKTLLAGGKVFTGGKTISADVLIEDGRVFDIRPDISENEAETVIHCDNCFLVPGLIDVHVHFREPGFEYKETIATGSASAAAGGYTTVCTMPNLDPAPWDMTGLCVQLDAIRRDADCRVIPYGRITGPSSKIHENDTGASEGGQEICVAHLEDTAPHVVAFSDDGASVQDDDLMEEAMMRAKALGKVIVAHAEDTRYAPEDPRSEYKQVERDIELVEKTGCAYHVCHVSTKESVQLIRDAKARGLDITCETAPHYLLLTKDNIPNVSFQAEEAGYSTVYKETENNTLGGRFKMNPPLRTSDDRQALLKGIADGTIDMIATDHAPHSADEKSKGFAGSMNGILGLETAFPVMYTHLVLGKSVDEMFGSGSVSDVIDDKDGNLEREGHSVEFDQCCEDNKENEAARKITFERLVELMSTNPAKRFGIDGGKIDVGAGADITIVDPTCNFVIDPEKFKSKGRSTPFEGMQVRGKIVSTIYKGQVIYECQT